MMSKRILYLPMAIFMAFNTHSHAALAADQSDYDRTMQELTTNSPSFAGTGVPASAGSASGTGQGVSSTGTVAGQQPVGMVSSQPPGPRAGSSNLALNVPAPIPPSSVFRPRAISAPSLPAMQVPGTTATPPVSNTGIIQSTISVKWSTLPMPVIADGKTDNTAALNNLPVNKKIIGDCPAGKSIILTKPWIWKSNLNLIIQPNCQIISSVSGGSYAITQTDLSVPITNVSVDGLNIAKSVAVTTERIMMLWVDHFTLLHWTVTASGGVMFLRGSDQDIGYGTVTGIWPEPGNPGIRHIGNLPKVPTRPGQPANVYIHDNNMQSGDAVYQACQPLDTSLWTNVSSDDILFQNNTGFSSAAPLLLVGLGAIKHEDWSCNNISVNNMSGSGIHWSVLISVGTAPNTVSNIRLNNMTIDDSRNASPGGAVAIIGSADPSPGSITNVIANQIAIKNLTRVAVETKGQKITDFVLQNSMIDTPTVGGLPTISLQDTAGTKLFNNTIPAYYADAIAVGAADGDGTHPVTLLQLAGNKITNVGNNRSGINLVNVSSGSIRGNTISAAPGANRAIGITFGQGTVGTLANGNDLSAISSNLAIIFNASGNNKALGNINAPDYR